MKLNEKQTQLLQFINAGKIVTQKNNRLYVNGEVLNTKTLISLMFKLYGGNYRTELKKIVNIVN
jgi:hypothetical protein